MTKYIKATKESSMNQKVAPNIVNIRKNKDPNSIQLNNIEDSINHAKQIRTELSNDLSELTFEQLMGWFNSYAIMPDVSKVDHRDLIMIENAITATIYRYYGLEHPLHEVTEEVFLFDEEDLEES